MTDLIVTTSPPTRAAKSPTVGTARRPTRSLLWRLSMVNVSILVVVMLLLVLTPITIHAPPHTVEIVLIVAGFLIMATANVLLVRNRLAPLRRLASFMEVIDPLEPGRRLAGVKPHATEVAVLTDAFDAMLDRVELERRESARRALQAQEQERLRIARELHDEIGQTLTAVAIEAERASEAAVPADSEAFTRIAAWAQESVEELRRIARELRPEALDDLGLVNAFIALSTRVAEQSGLEIERRLPDKLPPHSSEIDLVVYRVAQEALTNVMRHAEASHTTIVLEARRDRILLTVTDNGRGLAPADVNASTNGLAGMRERALLVGGAFQVQSRLGGGTEVTLDVPLTVAP
jgi:two-component system sensor histidine kinase UhpB